MARNLLIPPVPRGPLAEAAENRFLAVRPGNRAAQLLSLRIYSFAVHLAERDPTLRVPDEVWFAGAHLYLPGLKRQAGQPRNRVERMLQFAAPVLEMASPEHQKILKDWIRFQLRVRPVHKIAPAAEILRRALVLESTLGVIRYGLPPLLVLGVFKQYAPHRFDRWLVGSWTSILRHIPFAFLRGPKI